MDLDLVFSMMAMMHVFARLTNNLFARAQRPRSAWMKRGMRGSNAGPKPADKTVMSLIAEPESLLRSELIAPLSDPDNERIAATISVANSHPPLLQHSVSWTMPCSIASQVSSVS